MPHHLTQRLCPTEMATWSTARTLCFIGRWLRFWDQAIRKMSFEYKRSREAGKHFLGWLSVCYSIRIRFNAQNNPFCKRLSFIQSTLVFLHSWRICHTISSVQVEPAKNDNRNLHCFRKGYNSTVCKEKCGSRQRRYFNLYQTNEALHKNRSLLLMRS